LAECKKIYAQDWFILQLISQTTTFFLQLLWCYV